MVECKYNAVLRFCRTHPVLIDTWWNVNLFRWIEMSYDTLVLIDTWWNVNSLPDYLLQH